MTHAGSRPRAVAAIAIVNAAGASVTLVFWGLVFVRVFAAGTAPPQLDAGSLSATFGFMIGDLTWAFALQAVAAVGLWRMRAWGWLSAQLVNILWLYSMTVIWSRDAYGGRISPGAVLFLPFVPFAAWALVYLWSRRERFGAPGPQTAR